MHTYRPKIHVPVFVDKTIVVPLLVLRRIWYGYSFRRIPLANSSEYAIVDPAAYYRLAKYTWWAHKKHGVYRAVRLTQGRNCTQPIFMHRQIMNGPLRQNSGQVKLYVDHINRNGLDNRRANLRLATNRQNSMNRRGLNKTSQYKGVYFRPNIKKWVAGIGVNDKRVHLGCFEDEIEAARAYDKAAKKYYGEFAYLNFPPEREQKGLKNKIKAILDFDF